MLPPVEEAVLRNNPDFAALYTTLTTVILNPDGSTKHDAAAKERAAVKKLTAQEAKAIRLRAAKHHLIVEALSATAPPTAAPESTPATADGRPSAIARRAARTASRPAQPARAPPLSAPRPAADLPPDLQDLLVLLPALLRVEEGRGGASGGMNGDDSGGGGLAADDLALLLASPPLSSLPALLPRLAALVSETLQASALGVARVLHPATNSSYLHRTVPGLPAEVAALRADIADAQVALAAARHTTATQLLALLDGQAAALAALLRALEAQQGPVARSLELRAAEVALDAQAAAIDARAAQAAAHCAVYPSPSAARALHNYAQHLKDSKMRLDETLRERRALLREYGVDVDADAAAAAKAAASEDADADLDGDADTDAADAPLIPADSSKGRTMREMARVYRAMGQQMQEIQGDLARLGCE